MRALLFGVGAAARGRTLRWLAVLLWIPTGAAAQLPPHARWRQFDTDHFEVVYPEGLEPVARRAAARAEWVYDRLAATFVAPPRGKIYLVVSDNLDFPQGVATPIPWNRVVLYAAPAITVPEIEFTDDWLAMGVAHELAHIFHLDRAGGLWAGTRLLLGRSPLGFPAVFQPTWVKEGLATYFESSLTGSGRVHGTYHSMLLRSAAGDGTLRPLDDWDGLSPWWPAGRSPYAYGSRFLAARAGADSGRALGTFVREAAGNLWGLGLDGDAKRAFGRGFHETWTEWAASLRADAGAAGGRGPGVPTAGGKGAVPESRSPRVIAGPARSITGPRFDPGGRRIAFEYYDAKGDRVTRVVSLDGRTASDRRRNSPGTLAWSRDGRKLYYDQLEFTDRYTVAADLFALDVETGREVRWTRGERLRMPDLAPDADRWIAVETVPGTNRLVLLEPAPEGGPRATPLTDAELDVHWADPRWSPDGGRIAVSRWERGGFYDLVILDREGRLVRRLTHDRAVDGSPAWSPDGRYLLWSSDRGGIRNVWAYDLEVPAGEPGTYRVTEEVGGAFEPEVSPDGRWLAYVAHTGRGFVLRIVSYDPESWSAEPLPPAPRDPVADTYADSLGGPARPYSPGRSLLPTSWLPISTGANAEQGVFLGPLVYGWDVVGRHAYGVALAVSTRTADGEAFAGYTYSGLGNPALGLEVEQDWALAFTLSAPTGATPVLERSRSLALSALWVRPRFRHRASLEWTLELRRRDLFPAESGVALPEGIRAQLTEYGTELRLRSSTARSYPFSISAERGVRAALRLRGFRAAEDPHLWFGSSRGRVRAYLPARVFGFARHVLAVRVAGGATVYDGPPAVFLLGGVPGTSESLVPGISLGEGVGFPVRGFAEGAVAGDRVVSGNLEYRFPLALFSRGLGLTPIYLDRLAGALFVDAGSAWEPESGRAQVLSSVGAEIHLDVVLSHALPYRVRGGVARQLSGPGSEGWRFHLALGSAF